MTGGADDAVDAAARAVVGTLTVVAAAATAPVVLGDGVAVIEGLSSLLPLLQLLQLLQLLMLVALSQRLLLPLLLPLLLLLMLWR